MPGRPNDDNSTEWMTQSRSRFARRRSEKPTTKAGQIWALWPDIEAALNAGHTMKTICVWLAEDAGIMLGVTSLTSYVSRIRRRQRAIGTTAVHLSACSDPMSSDALPELAGLPTAILPKKSAGASGWVAAPKFDPLANYRARQGRNSGFNYRPATMEDEKDLI